MVTAGVVVCLAGASEGLAGASVAGGSDWAMVIEAVKAMVTASIK